MPIFTGVVHPPGEPEGYVGLKHTVKELEAAASSLAGVTILDSHDDAKPLGKVTRSWLAPHELHPEKTVWYIEGKLDESADGFAAAARMRKGELRGLSLGSHTEVFIDERAGTLATGAKRVTEVSVCTLGDRPNTDLFINPDWPAEERDAVLRELRRAYSSVFPNAGGAAAAAAPPAADSAAMQVDEPAAAAPAQPPPAAAAAPAQPPPASGAAAEAAGPASAAPVPAQQPKVAAHPYMSEAGRADGAHAAVISAQAMASTQQQQQAAAAAGSAAMDVDSGAAAAPTTPAAATDDLLKRISVLEKERAAAAAAAAPAQQQQPRDPATGQFMGAPAMSPQEREYLELKQAAKEREEHKKKKAAMKKEREEREKREAEQKRLLALQEQAAQVLQQLEKMAARDGKPVNATTRTALTDDIKNKPLEESERAVNIIAQAAYDSELRFSKQEEELQRLRKEVAERAAAAAAAPASEGAVSELLSRARAAGRPAEPKQNAMAVVAQAARMVDDGPAAADDDRAQVPKPDLAGVLKHPITGAPVELRGVARGLRGMRQRAINTKDPATIEAFNSTRAAVIGQLNLSGAGGRGQTTKAPMVLYSQAARERAGQYYEPSIESRVGTIRSFDGESHKGLGGGTTFEIRRL